MKTKIALALIPVIYLFLMSSNIDAQTPPTSTGATTAAPTTPPAKPKPCTSPAYRQFDFWIGDWDVTNPAGKLVGTNLIKPILGGCVLHENWFATGGGF
ncbi:MAG: hypothetical protein ABI583_10295, partial [Betaproteobacteria bacterium]